MENEIDQQIPSHFHSDFYATEEYLGIYNQSGLQDQNDTKYL